MFKRIGAALMAWCDRMVLWTGRMLICLDQLLGVWLRGWAYVWFNAGGEPSADMTISDYVGQNAEAGKRWALACEACINFVFGEGHCRRAISTDSRD